MAIEDKILRRSRKGQRIIEPAKFKVHCPISSGLVGILVWSLSVFDFMPITRVICGDYENMNLNCHLKFITIDFDSQNEALKAQGIPLGEVEVLGVMIYNNDTAHEKRLGHCGSGQVITAMINIPKIIKPLLDAEFDHPDADNWLNMEFGRYSRNYNAAFISDLVDNMQEHIVRGRELYKNKQIALYNEWMEHITNVDIRKRK